MTNQTEIVHIPLNKLTKSDRNVRKTGGDSIAELAASIQAHGLLHNLVVTRTKNEKYKVICEWDHILAVSATLCFPNATAKLCFRVLNVEIHKHPGRRTNAERDLVQGAFAPKPPVRPVPAWIQERWLSFF